MKKLLTLSLTLLVCFVLLLTGCTTTPTDPQDTTANTSAGTTDSTTHTTSSDETSATPKDTTDAPEDTSEDKPEDSQASENHPSDTKGEDEPEVEVEVTPEDFVIPQCQTYWYFDYVDGAEKLARVSHADGKIYLIEKFPLCYYDDENMVEAFPTKDNLTMACNNVFGTVTDKYFFTYNGDTLESVTYFQAKSDITGKSAFELGYVMKINKNDLLEVYENEIYVNGMRASCSDTIMIDRFGNGGYLRSILADLNSGYRIDIEYDDNGRPVLISDNTSPSFSYFMVYGEDGNVMSAQKIPSGEGHYDPQEAYTFTFENGVLTAMTYENNRELSKGSYQALLSYDTEGRFINADVVSEYVQGSVSVTYDDQGRVTEYQMPDLAQGGYMIVRTFTYGDHGLYTSVNTQMLSWDGESTGRAYLDVPVTMTYDQKGNLTELTYLDSIISPNAQTITATMTYTADGKLASDGTFEYTYDEKGNLVKKAAVDGSIYTEYYANGMVKEQKYVRRGYDDDFNVVDYVITDYYQPSDIYYVAGSMISSYGSAHAEKSVSVRADGMRYETTRTFDDLHIMTEYKTVIYDAEGNEVTR